MLLELDDFPTIQNLYKEAIKNMEEAIINIDQVKLILACSKWSSKTMIALGGIKTQERMHNDVVVERYAINVSDSLNKYKDLYGKQYQK